MDLSDRVCQFYLRGRCQRENCEFKHCKPEKSSDMKEQEKEKETTAQEEKVPEAQAVAKKVIIALGLKITNYFAKIFYSLEIFLRQINRNFRKKIFILKTIIVTKQNYVGKSHDSFHKEFNHF